MQTYQPTDPVKNNSRIIFTALVVSWIIIWVWIRWVFFKEVPQVVTSVDSPSETEQNEQRRYIWKKVLLSWIISKRSWFWLSTHIFVDSDTNEFGARSEIVNLSDFEWEVQIKWEIVDFDKEIPIVLVQDAIKSWVDANALEVPEWNSNFWYSKEAWLWIDLSASQWYVVTENGSEIRIVESTNLNEPLLSIKPFACVPWNALQDCADLRDKFTRFGNETFTNSKGITFYNLTETNTWFIFDEPIKWYSLRSNTDNSVASFSDLIQIINQQEVNSFLENNKNDYCRSLESSMDTVQEIESSLIKPWLLEINATWASAEWNEVTCTVYAILWENNVVIQWQYNDSSIEKAYEQEVVWAQELLEPEVEVQDIQEQSTDEPENQEVEVNTWDVLNDIEEVLADTETQEEVEEEVEALPLAVVNGSIQEPESLDGRLQYSSVRWFVMYFSKQWVSYVWEILESESTLWMENATCRYKVNVIAWNQADNVSISPDLAVFECTWTTPTSSQSQWLNIQIVWETDNSFFAVQRYTTNLGEIQVYVE